MMERFPPLRWNHSLIFPYHMNTRKRDPLGLSGPGVLRSQLQLPADLFVGTAALRSAVRERCLEASLRMIRASLQRARATCAFTVPSATPNKIAVSFVVKPSMSRNWNVLRRVGESWLAMVSSR